MVKYIQHKIYHVSHFQGYSSVSLSSFLLNVKCSPTGSCAIQSQLIALSTRAVQSSQTGFYWKKQVTRRLPLITIPMLPTQAYFPLNPFPEM